MLLDYFNICYFFLSKIWLEYWVFINKGSSALQSLNFDY